MSVGNLAFDKVYDHTRQNQELIMLASSARTASANSEDFANFYNKGGHFIIDVSAVADTPSIVATIQGKDPASGTYYDLISGIAITATGIQVLKIYPGIFSVANAAASDVLPKTFRASVANADSDSITYSVSVVLIA
jgi:hypothetical protein